MNIPYWNYAIESGDFIDPDERFIYIEDAGPSSSGYRRARVKEATTGEIFEASFVALRTRQAKTPSEKEESRRVSSINKAKYHEGDIIGKYHDILILDLDAEKYPPKARQGNKSDRCGLFKNLVTGEEFVTTLNHAIQKSSGKVQSIGEKHIAELLNDYNVKYEEQKTYDGLTGFFCGKSLAFDFYLPDKHLLVEYDGTQHLLSHQDEVMFYATETEQYIYYARDIMKESWCCANKTPLLRISNVSADELDYDTLNAQIERALDNAEHGIYITFYPEESERDYESVSVTMSHLDARYQYDFYRNMRDADIHYRRQLDLPLEEDAELLRALPNDATPPVLFEEPKPRSFYKQKRIPIVIGDIIGNNGVKYIGDFDDDGNKIESPAGRRKALFECSCGRHFISTFNSVRGSESNRYEGKLCDVCTAERRKRKMKETIAQRPPKEKQTFAVGEYIDAEQKFKYIEELEPTSDDRRFLVEDNHGARFEFSLSYLKTGKAKDSMERQQEKEERSYRKITAGDIIGIDKCLVAQHDVEYHTYDDYREIPIVVFNTETHKTYAIKLSSALFSHTTGTRGTVTHLPGEEVGKMGVIFLAWCNEDGTPLGSADVADGGLLSEYARFRCSCKDKNEFVAKWASVRDIGRQCPSCMARREKESRRKNGLSHRLSLSPGDPVSPDGQYLYVSEDENATTKKRKIIIKDKDTGETFSYQFDKVRQGTIVPPSQSKKNRRRGHDDNQKYQIGDIISNSKASHCIVGELETEINSQGNPVRRFVFQNLNTGYLFDSVMQPVKSGVVTGARSKKTRADYPGVTLLSEDEVEASVKADKTPQRSKKSDMEILNEAGEEKIQTMLRDKSSTQIAAELGIAFQTVCRFVKEHGLHNPHTNDENKIDVSQMPLDAIKKKLDAGQSMTSIGKELGYGYAWMKKAVECIEQGSSL